MKNNFLIDLLIFLVGILFIIFPDFSSKLIIYGISLGIILSGITTIVKNYKLSQFKTTSGITYIIIGILIACFASTLLEIIFILLGIFILLYSIVLFYTAFFLKKLHDSNDSNWINKLTQAIIYTILGIFFITNSFTTKKIIFIITGIILIMVSINNIRIKFTTKNINNANKDEYIDIEP